MAPERSIRSVAFTGQAEDFPVWKVKFKALMESHGYRAILVGDEKREQAKDKEEWSRLNRKVFALLVLALDDENVRLISMSCDDVGQSARKLLWQEYQGKDSLGINNLRTELLMTQCEGAHEVGQFVVRIKELCQQINWAEQQAISKEESQYVLRGLPQDYESFVTSTQILPNEEFSQFEERLRAFTNNQVFHDGRGTSVEGSALFARRQPRRGRQGTGGYKSGGDRRECFNCGKTRHFKRNCTEPGGGKAADNKSYIAMAF
jgi:hypothetical protein